jgi:hypothetical protein
MTKSPEASNVISLIYYRMMADANADMKDIVAIAEKQVLELSTVNLLELKPGEHQKSIRLLQQFKFVASQGKPHVIAAIALETKRLGRVLTPEELIEITRGVEPDAFVVRMY